MLEPLSPVKYSDQIVDCAEIVAAIKIALSDKFKTTYKNPYDPYQDGQNSDRIAFAINNCLTLRSREDLIVKKFNTVVKKDQWNSLLEGFK